MDAAARAETFGFNHGRMKERRRLIRAGPDGVLRPRVKSSNATKLQLLRHKDQPA